MHTVKDYRNSPAKAFDAVEDVKEYFGNRWAEVSPLMREMTNPKQFSQWAAFSGVYGYPVEAWYELYHGEGSWAKAWEEVEAEAKPVV